MLAVSSTWLRQEGWGHLTRFTFKRLSFRAPTKGTGYLKPCYFTTASQLGQESSTENALQSGEDVKKWCRGQTWHTMPYVCLAGIIPHFWPWTENLHSACLRNNLLRVSSSHSSNSVSLWSCCMVWLRGQRPMEVFGDMAPSLQYLCLFLRLPPA